MYVSDPYSYNVLADRNEAYIACGTNLHRSFRVELDVAIFIIVDVHLQNARDVHVAAARRESAGPNSSPATVPARTAELG